MQIREKKRVFFTLIALAVFSFLILVVAFSPKVFSQPVAPAVNSFSPNPVVNTVGANPGTISGSDFVQYNPTTGDGTIAFIGTAPYVGGVQFIPVFIDSNTLQITIPAANPMDPALLTGNFYLWASTISINPSAGEEIIVVSNAIPIIYINPTPSINSILPSQFFNNQATTLNIQGSGFTINSVLNVFDSGGNLLFSNPNNNGAFTVLNTNNAFLIVPAGLTPGNYFIGIDNPGSSGISTILVTALNSASPNTPLNLVVTIV